MTESETDGYPDRTKVGWRIAQGIGTPVAVILAVLSLNRWWFFVNFMITSGHVDRARESMALVMFGFLLWFILWWAGAIIVTIVWGLRHIVAKLALGIGLLLTVVAIVVPFV